MMPRQDDNTLNMLLDNWKTRHLLTDARAETIRKNLLFNARTSKGDLSAEWWHNFTCQLSSTICDVTKINNNIMLTTFSACGIYGTWKD